MWGDVITFSTAPMQPARARRADRSAPRVRRMCDLLSVKSAPEPRDANELIRSLSSRSLIFVAEFAVFRHFK
jgi:hypothetical protein